MILKLHLFHVFNRFFNAFNNFIRQFLRKKTLFNIHENVKLDILYNLGLGKSLKIFNYVNRSFGRI